MITNHCITVMFQIQILILMSIKGVNILISQPIYRQKTVQSNECVQHSEYGPLASSEVK